MWTKSENDSNIKPASVEHSGSGVIVRKRFELVRATEEMPEHWKYDEIQMTAEQYDIYQMFDAQLSEQADALIELAELITEG